MIVHRTLHSSSASSTWCLSGLCQTNKLLAFIGKYSSKDMQAGSKNIIHWEILSLTPKLAVVSFKFNRWTFERTSTIWWVFDAVSQSRSTWSMLGLWIIRPAAELGSRFCAILGIHTCLNTCLKMIENFIIPSFVCCPLLASEHSWV